MYGRTALFEKVIEGLTGLISKHRERNTEVLRFPPVINRAHIEKAGYLHSFPNLLGAVSCLSGDEMEIRRRRRPAGQGRRLDRRIDAHRLGADAGRLLPHLSAGRGTRPHSRQTASSSMSRATVSATSRRRTSTGCRASGCGNMFVMGSPEQASDFRDRWIKRGQEIADQLGLKHSIAPASDPFFGRAAKLMADSQIEQALKFELLIAVRSEEQPTACMSFNCHRDHFGTKWNLRDEAGEVAHTACAAFGMDRLALAMFATHGTELRNWPASVRATLSL